MAEKSSVLNSLGFIGGGNIGLALAKVMAARFPQTDIQVCDLRPERLELFRRELPRVRIAAAAPELVQQVETVILAVKPQDIQPVLESIAGTDRLVLSLAAGVTIARLEDVLRRARVVRVMPNTPCLVGAMAAGYAFGSRVRPADRSAVEELLKAAGYAAPVEERLLDAVTGLSGSGPAFVARLIEAFIEAGIGLDLEAGIARDLAVHTFLGTARLLDETAMEPGTLVDMVSSPNGTTVAGCRVLESCDYRELIRRTIEAAAQRSEELGR